MCYGPSPLHTSRPYNITWQYLNPFKCVKVKRLDLAVRETIKLDANKTISVR